MGNTENADQKQEIMTVKSTEVFSGDLLQFKVPGHLIK